MSGAGFAGLSADSRACGPENAKVRPIKSATATISPPPMNHHDLRFGAFDRLFLCLLFTVIGSSEVIDAQDV